MSQDGARGSKPELKLGSHLVPGLAAVALFVVMALVFLTSSFPLEEAAGFPEGASITASIGYAMFNITGGPVPAEGFLVAFLVIAVVLDIAIDGAIFLAKRGDEGVLETALSRDSSERTDGGSD
ncbi:proton-conducting membrane transporter [Halorarum halobium]|uniref:proton-conducting membrane transporter n=1 Tax=Halorarum halobium TaxID=3075121 RepID=UPI0028AD8286|nr:proton-conducting membrane transporter [Halobaculum sp. XH14]